jgi:hypothetical protein
MRFLGRPAKIYLQRRFGLYEKNKEGKGDRREKTKESIRKESKQRRKNRKTGS